MSPLSSSKNIIPNNMGISVTFPFQAICTLCLFVRREFGEHTKGRELGEAHKGSLFSPFRCLFVFDPLVF